MRTAKQSFEQLDSMRAKSLSKEQIKEAHKKAQNEHEKVR